MQSITQGAPILRVHPEDNLIVALQDLSAGMEVALPGGKVVLQETIPAKHKFAEVDFQPGDAIYMYGITVGVATQAIAAGSRITIDNISHHTDGVDAEAGAFQWQAPDVSAFEGRTFEGFHRADGQVGTRNYWLVIPLVFCENRNIEVIKDTMLEALGYGVKPADRFDLSKMIDAYRSGASEEDLLNVSVHHPAQDSEADRVFPQVDGIKFLTHDGGCGGIRQDSDTLCRLLAGYLTHPNVAGATILSLGCQNAQIPILKDALAKLDPAFSKPLYFHEQQQSRSEVAFIEAAIRTTFVGLTEANKAERAPAPLSKLTLGLECGGSDGFSGISANPALGYASDLLVALKARVILAEFPELNGVEPEIVKRCQTADSAERFKQLMKDYAAAAVAVGSGFDMNPSPGNIKDGLVTDAMKSAGAAKKGGTSPVVDILDYTEPARQSGLNLLCTPGNDVESTTGLAGSWANVMVFTTGLGTPTGNPIAPVVKMSSNTSLAERMPDIIDVNAGQIITGEATIESLGTQLLERIIEVANGDRTRAEILGQDDFIPWKRGISL
ncbi:altronate dehydratase family protein [Pontibacter sp. G13]|uniref:UxaA family hydrolase n=1 Tax=Pontibacter sp. G13 TaxID=3074898 RepID=UPI00288966C8|nr:altronate dehydratase family protein [Pontibacter sp. G13]WNJ20075.1 altronate dehydratase family protein [Pontibacter sp. G13]